MDRAADMTVLLQIGIRYPSEFAEGIGHVACTLGGVNYESRGGHGCLKGSAARGATSPLFLHHFHTVLTSTQAKRAKQYADSCIGEPYVWDQVPGAHHGGDCSGFVSGIICAAKGLAIHRLFSTGDWTGVDERLGFSKGLGGNVTPTPDPVGVQDRPYPGYPILEDSPKPAHIRWIQARLNYAFRHDGVPLAIDGEFGPLTLKSVIRFQRAHGLQGLGDVGPLTWADLNKVR